MESFGQPAHAAHPVGAALGPIVDGVAILAHAKAMAALGENVQFGGEALLLVGEIEHGGLDGVGFVVVGDEEEGGWRVGRYAEAGAEPGLIGLIEEAAAVDHDDEVGPGIGIVFWLLRIGAISAV